MGSTSTSTPRSQAQQKVEEDLQRQLAEVVQRKRNEKSSAFEKFGKAYFDHPAKFAQDCVKWPDGEAPTAYQEMIWELIPEKERVAVRGPHGLGKCLAETERVPLADGRLITAKDLIGRYFAVLAYEPDGEQRPSLAWAESDGIKRVYRVTTQSGRTIVRTGNHPLLSARLRQHAPRQPINIAWTPIDDLKHGALVLCPEELQCRGSHRASDDEVKLLGYLLGDGGVTSGIRFTQKPGPARDEFCEIVERLGSAWRLEGDITVCVTGPDRVIFGDGSNPVLTLIRKWGLVGKKSIDKRFPDWVWELPNDQLALLLNRLFSCDGYAYTYDKTSKANGRIQRQGRIGITLASEGMIRDIELVLLRLGINGQIRHRKVTYQGAADFHGKKTFDAWEWASWRSSEINRFAEVVGIYGKEAAVQRAVEACCPADEKKLFKWFYRNCPIGYRWEKIDTIEDLGEQPTVSITVEPTHTFLTTFVEHNSASCSIAILWFALTREALRLDWKLPVTASVQNQLKNYLWPEVKKWSRRLNWDRVGRPAFNQRSELLTMELHLVLGQAFCVSPEEPGKLEGAHADHLFFCYDEAKLIEEGIWDAAEGAFAGSGPDTGMYAFALAISTPGEPSGRFYQIHQKAKGWSRGTRSM
jgi:intein/homing endonuclease